MKKYIIKAVWALNAADSNGDFSVNPEWLCDYSYDEDEIVEELNNRARPLNGKITLLDKDKYPVKPGMAPRFSEHGCEPHDYYVLVETDKSIDEVADALYGDNHVIKEWEFNDMEVEYDEPIYHKEVYSEDVSIYCELMFYISSLKEVEE